MYEGTERSNYPEEAESDMNFLQHDFTFDVFLF